MNTKATKRTYNLFIKDFTKLKEIVQYMNNSELRYNYNKSKWLVFQSLDIIGYHKTYYFFDKPDTSLISIDLNVYKTKPQIIDEVANLVLIQSLKKFSKEIENEYLDYYLSKQIKLETYIEVLDRLQNMN